MPRRRTGPEPQQLPKQTGIRVGAGQAEDPGDRHPGSFPETGHGGGPRVLQGRHGGGGHVSRGGHFLKSCKAQAYSGY